MIKADAVAGGAAPRAARQGDARARLPSDADPPGTGPGIRQRLAVASCMAILLASAVPAGLSRVGLQVYDFAAEVSRQWKLPDKLNEISGLATTTDGRLLAVADEAAIVYELDYEKGRLVKAFALGDPAVRGDFEGIATLEERVWLVTSDGLLYEAAEGVDGERVVYEVHRTDVGRSCEIEGLTARQAGGALLLLCKNLRRGSELDGLAIFVWSPAERRVLHAETIMLPDRRIVNELRDPRLRPSGLAVDGHSGNLLIVAARPGAVIEMTADGTFVAAAELRSGARHRQPEGIEVLSDGGLLIADEGGGHKARLAVYRPDGRRAGAGE